METKALATGLALLIATSSLAQSNVPSPAKSLEVQSETSPPPEKVIVVTGVRFSYTLIEGWIHEYNKVDPNVQVIIEPKGSADTRKYDILAEVYEQEAEVTSHREYIKVGRYAVLPVANNASAFANVYAKKGLTRDLINQVFFHDMFSDEGKQRQIEVPYTVYTRLEKAGVPILFLRYFGHKQKDVKGISIAGADAHLLKALLRDSTGVTYLPLPLIYDEQTRKPVDGLAVLPVDLNGNRKVNDDERFYDTVDRVIETLEAEDPAEINNIPIAYLHLSVDKTGASAAAINFLKWVTEHGQDHLHTFGFLRPEEKYFVKENFLEFASRHGR